MGRPEFGSGCSRVLQRPGPDLAAIDTIFDQVPLAANLVADDYRPSSVHNLIDHQAPWFVDRCQDEHVTQVIEPWQSCLVLEPQKADIAGTR